jgi:hypothetical protein
LLEERSVRFVGGAVAAGVRRDGSLGLAAGGLIQADRVLALPELRGRRFTGIPASRSGFVPVDASGHVERLDDVYAAGDMTMFPIKRGGLAAQQADVVAQTIAAGLGIAVKQIRGPRVLHASVIGGESPVFLRTEFDWSGRPTRGTVICADDDEDAKAAKVLVTSCLTLKRGSRCRTIARRRWRDLHPGKTATFLLRFPALFAEPGRLGVPATGVICAP